jgi:molecular chaperone GrpE
MPKKIEDESQTGKNNDQEIEIEYLTNKKPDHKKKKKKDAELEVENLKDQKKKIKKKNSEIKNLKEEVDKFREDYLRNAAENENFRKRLEREKKDYFLYSLSEVLKDFLDVLDNFERALDIESDKDNKNFHEGINMIYKQFQDTLKKHNVTPVETDGKRFDPQVQQAFITEESDSVKEPEVAEVLQQGYRLNERLLRPSLVKVLVKRKEK